MTVVEFIDTAPIDNVLGVLSAGKKPDKIIYVGSDLPNTMEKVIGRYTTYFTNKIGVSDVGYVQVDVNDFADIYSKLGKIADASDECCFDATGGEDAVLLALGALCHARKNVNISRVDLAAGKKYRYGFDADTGKPVLEGSSVSISNSVEENIAIHGGAIVYDTDRPDGTHIYGDISDCGSDIMEMWNICHRNIREWNFFVNEISIISDVSRNNDPLQIIADRNFLLTERVIKNSFKPLCSFLTRFNNAGLTILSADEEYDSINIVFKNDIVKRCMTKAGTLLELVTYVECLKICNGDNEACLTGVTIDWDGIIHNFVPASRRDYMSVSERRAFELDTTNEIDVLLVKGMIPIFISCKNGAFDAQELYKLDAVCNRFGAKYGRKIVIASDFDEIGTPEGREYIENRARDMGIKLIKGIANRSMSDLGRTIAAAINGH